MRVTRGLSAIHAADLNICGMFYPMARGDDVVLRLFQKHGGVLRTGEAQALGIHPRVLYRLRDEGKLETLSRGVLRVVEGSELSAPDLVAVAKRVPRAVVCLVSALHVHGMTTEV